MSFSSLLSYSDSTNKGKTSEDVIMVICDKGKEVPLWKQVINEGRFHKGNKSRKSCQASLWEQETNMEDKTLGIRENERGQLHTTM